MPTLLKRDRRFVWDGLTLRNRAVLTGTDLSPKWALVRVRRELEEAKVGFRVEPGDSGLEFDKSLLAISMTAAYLPYEITGEIKAETVPDGLIVTASTSIGRLVGGLALSVIGITIFFRMAGAPLAAGYLVLLGVAAVATGLHIWQAANFLRRVTDAATTL